MCIRDRGYAILRQAVIAVEDAGFYANPGVDARGLLRAMLQMARERREMEINRSGLGGGLKLARGEGASD